MVVPITIIWMNHEWRRAAHLFYQALGCECLGMDDGSALQLPPLGIVEELIAFSEINFLFLPEGHRLRGELEQHLKTGV